MARACPLFILILVAATSCGEDTTSIETDEPPVRQMLKIPADAPRVIFLGDSIAAGLHLEDPLSEAFPARLQTRLADNAPFHLVNAGVSGDTTAGGLRRLSWMLDQSPDLLVIELGANDGLRGVPLPSVAENLRGIVRGAKAAGVAVLLLGIRLPPNLGKEYTAGFAAIYADVGKTEAVEAVPFFMEGVAGHPDLNFPDGIHPTAAGHAKLADNVEPALRSVLGRIRR